MGISGSYTMGIKTFYFLIAVGTVIAAVAAGRLMTSLDPSNAGGLAFIFFYVSSFLVLGGMYLLISEFLKRRFTGHKAADQRLARSVRHSLFFASLIIGWLLLKSFGLVRWWNVLLLIVVLTLLEFFFISFKRQPPVLR